jgi:hypothetical protein
VNNKILIRADTQLLNDRSKNDTVVEIHGVKYIERTDDNLSDSTLDTQSVVSDMGFQVNFEFNNMSLIFE